MTSRNPNHILVYLKFNVLMFKFAYFMYKTAYSEDRFPSIIVKMVL